MSDLERRPRPPDDLDLEVDEVDLRAVSAGLRRYANLADDAVPAAFVDRVMAAVEGAPLRRGGPAGWLGGIIGVLAAPARRSLRMAALAAVVVIAVGGALVGAELSGLLRSGPAAGSSGSPSPTVSASPSSTPSASPTLEPSGTPDATETGGEQSATPGGEVVETAQPATSTRTPRPSESEDSGGSTPGASSTPKPGED